MMILVNMEFWGSDEELKKLDEALISAIDKTEGMEYLGRYGPVGSRWHWTYFIKSESYTTWDNMLKNFDHPRDKKIRPNETTEFYQ